MAAGWSTITRSGPPENTYQTTAQWLTNKPRCRIVDHMHTTEPTAATTDIIGRCQHCGVQQFDNPNADPALDSIAHLCWKCVQPHGCTYPKAI